MATRKATLIVKNTGNVDITFHLGFGLANATFDPRQGFPNDKYLGDLSNFSGNPADIRNITLKVGEQKSFQVTFSDDKLIDTYGGKTVYFLVCAWENIVNNKFTGLISYAFKDFTVTAVSIKYFDVSVDKTNLIPNETYTLTVYYTCDQGYYNIYLGDMKIGELDLTSGGQSGYKSFSLKAPSSFGSYTYTVTIENAYTKERKSKSYGITVSGILGSFDAVPSKSKATTGETIYITYKVNLNRNADIDLVLQNSKERWYNQSAGYHEYNKYITLPSSPGTYTYSCGVEIPATGEKSYKNVSITVVAPVEVKYLWYGVTRAGYVDVSFTVYNNTSGTLSLEVSLANKTTGQTYYDIISVGANSSYDYYKSFGYYNQVYGCSYTLQVKRRDNGQVVFSKNFSL